MPRITLIGYRGTGKSTVAGILARRLQCPWHDADAVLETRIGNTIAAFVRKRGEPAFRDEEAAVLRELLEQPGVLATGGGVVLRAENRELLRRLGRPLVWLQAPVDVLRRRLAADPATAERRPALSGADPLAEVEEALRTREPLYSECADAAFDVAADAPERIAARILDWLATTAPGGEPQA
ncbi:MAG: shikimate kinase [Planctomycetia bacterium]|nr:shikimate kinase [Planctomycetia bacterium]